MGWNNLALDARPSRVIDKLACGAAIAPAHGNALFFAGDIGQRIFRQPFSWKTLGIDVRGRSHNLRVNYRITHQIKQAADRLLPQAPRDVDGVEDDRHGTVSVFQGIEPTIVIAGDENRRARCGAGVRSHGNG